MPFILQPTSPSHLHAQLVQLLPSTITITNRSPVDITISYIEEGYDPQPIETLAVNQFLDVDTFLGHVFLITETTTGSILDYSGEYEVTDRRDQKIEVI